MNNHTNGTTNSEMSRTHIVFFEHFLEKSAQKNNVFVNFFLKSSKVLKKTMFL